MTPGVQIELSPDAATALGAFEETALSEADAWEANSDVNVDVDVDVDMKEAQDAL